MTVGEVEFGAYWRQRFNNNNNTLNIFNAEKSVGGDVKPASDYR